MALQPRPHRPGLPLLSKLPAISPLCRIALDEEKIECELSRMPEYLISIMQVPVDSWPKSADRVLELAGLLLAASHVIFLILFVLWYGLRKPGSLALFRARLWAAVRGRPLPEAPAGPRYDTQIFINTLPELPKRGTLARRAIVEAAEARKRAQGGR